MSEIKNLIKFGNSKLPKTTMIFNMGPAHGCPSDKLGLCKVSNKCYAKCPEIQYPDCKPYRDRQAVAWLQSTAEEIAEGLISVLKRKRIKTKLFRFNESGDFYGQDCIDKLGIIAYQLKQQFGIITYGYSARKDLSFYFAPFKVKSSGYYNGNNGRTIVVGSKADVPSGYRICPGDCNKCTMCIKGYDIAFIEH